MCAGCFNHLLADARLKDETATCPNCRCEIGKTTCLRNLAVEKAVSELPSQCQYCNCQLPRHLLSYHEQEQCQERPCSCKYTRIGCRWRGPHHELQGHEETCVHPKKSGEEIMEALQLIQSQQEEKLKMYNDIFNLLSLEKVTFNDLQLKPYRTDDFLTKLFYETSRFTAFNQQWVIKAKVLHDQKDPTQSIQRSLAYQLVLKGKLTQPMSVYFIALKGPYGDTRIDQAIYFHEFTADSSETELQELPILDSIECNKLLAAKTINLRLIMFQLPGKQ
ncbi:hypothetical protein CHS0354_011977 [Potamilus streckersoni]|uniref:TRAF-type domain-containing protein n=1 Tax=Potamilus streckersoni TaxID=2493646 RepID=A0AAE0TFR8_9BIVA|nr:hypothetical protein CHS0354_011977 [Potamilus streckersoni]